jgi:hypothetical protein
MRVSLLVGLALVGCVSAPSSGPAVAPAEPAPHTNINRGDRDRIEKAYAAKDARALHELLDIVTDRDNHAVARDYYIKLQLDALLALDCDPFVAAFQPVHQHPNPHVEFGALTADLDAKQKAYIMTGVGAIAARCRSALLFSQAIRQVVPTADEAAWASALVELEHKGMPVSDAFAASLRATKSFDGKLAMHWLTASKAVTCHELDEAARGASIEARAFLVYGYVAKACRAEVVHGARELLTSHVAANRARGCRALREVGDASLTTEMQQLAKSDPARKLEDDRDGIWTYTFTTYPVRETCQQALDVLATRTP